MWQISKLQRYDVAGGATIGTLSTTLGANSRLPSELAPEVAISAKASRINIGAEQ